MIEYYHKIIEGTVLNGEHLELPRAHSIYDVARYQQPYVTDIECRSNEHGDEIILLKLCFLEVPDQPVFSIHEEEEIAIICHSEEKRLPEVYALRKDFPIGLPHSIATPFVRPVLLCVSDIEYADMRPQFNAYDFLKSIRRWFNLNSINKLHENDRPLDMYYMPKEVCCILNQADWDKTYVKYTQISNIKNQIVTSTIKFVDKLTGNPTHYLIQLPVKKVYSDNFVRIPQRMGDFQNINSTEEFTLIDILKQDLSKLKKRYVNLPILLLITINQKRTNGNDESYDYFIIKTENNTTINKIIDKMRKLSSSKFEEWFYRIQVKIALAEIMVSRRLNSIFNGITSSFSKISILGAGTLGSSVIDHIVREGIAEEIVIADYDILNPHNLSRHTMAIDKVMKTKLQAIKETYNGIFGQRINIIEKNALSMTEYEERRFFKDTQLVVDFSTSIAVEHHLANKDGQYRRCTSFLNLKGDEIVLMMEDKDRHHRLDLLEMDYYRNLIVDKRFKHHLEQGQNIRTNNFSCRAESTILNYENVRILSAIVSSQIRKHYMENECYLGIWRFDTSNGTVESIPMRISSWRILFSNENCTVWLSLDVEEEINQMSINSSTVETGGCLFGSYDRDYNTIYIYYMMLAPKDSIQLPVSFIRGFEGLEEEYERISKLTYNQVRYLGEWHSHPNMSNLPSSTDNQQFKELSEEQQAQDLPFVQIIHGNNGLFVRGVMKSY